MNSYAVKVFNWDCGNLLNDVRIKKDLQYMF